jgi:hypothetical protein
MHSNYIGLTIFGVVIIVGIGVFTYFKIKWGAEERAEKRSQAKRIEDKKNEERKQQNQN